jgi:hypothetical protein
MIAVRTNFANPQRDTMATTPQQLDTAMLESVRSRVADTGVFMSARVETRSHAHRLVCEATASAEPAFYSVFEDAGRVWVALQTPARYLSQSIEADLMFTGDKLPDLLHEELMEVGWAEVLANAPELPVEHFRTSDAEKLYTFRSPLPAESARSRDTLSDAIVAVLLAYEATFRELGDMTEDDE